MKFKKLYQGDCLEVMQGFPSASIDLCYIDPPFFSQNQYKTKDGRIAFEDKWDSRDQYLEFMRLRITEIHRLLKDTGSFYLHCDSTMSHYLKILLDIIFGEKNFRNEIVWKRTYAHNDPMRFGRNLDRILFYTKTKNYLFNPIYVEYDEDYIKNFFKKKDKRGLYQSVILTGSGISKGDSDIKWKGYKPSYSHRHWSIPKRIVNMLATKEKIEKMSISQRLDLLYANNYIEISKNGIPRFKQYLHEMAGAPAQENWTDIQPPGRKERLGYPTQKPEALLERIIKASSNEGDVILDAFCGCGTTLTVAEKLNRQWIGIDSSKIAIEFCKKRLENND